MYDQPKKWGGGGGGGGGHQHPVPPCFLPPWVMHTPCTSTNHRCGIISTKIIEWGCRDGMHYVKNDGNKEIPLTNTIKDTTTIMRNPVPEFM